MDPLTTEEVTALELDGSLESSVKYKQRYIDTIRDRERERDELLVTLSDLYARNIIEVGELQRERDDKEYARKEWAETAHRVILERDELQRKLDELRTMVIAYFDTHKTTHFSASEAELRKLAVQEGEGGTE